MGDSSGVAIDQDEFRQLVGRIFSGLVAQGVSPNAAASDAIAQAMAALRGPQLSGAAAGGGVEAVAPAPVAGPAAPDPGAAPVASAGSAGSAQTASGASSGASAVSQSAAARAGESDNDSDMPPLVFTDEDRGDARADRAASASASASAPPECES